MNKTDQLSMRRMTENEAVFRQSNEQTQAGLDELRSLAEAHDQPELAPSEHLELEFYCECSDENCRQRIRLSDKEYSQIHKNRSRFVVRPQHEVTEVESVIEERSGYTIVEKFLDPPENAQKLHVTDATNVPG